MLALLAGCHPAPHSSPDSGPAITKDAGSAVIAPSCEIPDGGTGLLDPVVAWTGAGPWSIQLGDFNNDGRADLAVVNGGISNRGEAPAVPGSSLTLLYSNGDGGYEPGVTLATQPGTLGLVVGDFGIGAQDLAVASCDEQDGGSGGALQLFTQQPNGIYTGLGPLELPSCPFSMASGDFNGDGQLDLVTAGPGLFGGGTDGGLQLILGQGNGAFASAIPYPMPANQWAVAALDVNGDGRLDFVSTGDDSTLNVFLNQGSGSFQALVPVALPQGPYTSIASADFNGDGHLDLVLAAFAQLDLLVLLGQGDGTFSAPQIVDTDISVASVTTADIDGDGLTDIVLGDAYNFMAGADLLFNEGDGGFSATTPLLTGGSGFGLLVADLNHDGFPDLAVSANGQDMVSVLFNGCGEPAVPDAGPFSTASHTPIPQMPTQGGPLLTSPQLVTIHYPDDPLQAHHEALDDWIVGSDWLAQVGTSYGVGHGADIAKVVLPMAAPTQISDTEIQQMLLQEIDAGVLPPPGPSDGGYAADTLYMIFVPPSTSVSGANVGTSCQSFDGYHSEDDLGDVNFAYAVVAICYGNENYQDISASHELIEAATDPFPFSAPAYRFHDFNDAWIYVNGGEVGDECEGRYLQQDGFNVQQIWSNDAVFAGLQPCQPSSSENYFMVSPTTPQTLMGSPGQTFTVELDGWSSGSVQPWGIRPSIISYAASLGTGFFTPQVTFDQVTMTNGGHATMTVTVPANASPEGFSAFRVYSDHATFDSNDNGGFWPFLITLGN